MTTPARFDLRPLGISASVPGNVSSAPRVKRGKCRGWTFAAARRNEKFLQGIDEKKMNGFHYCITLTVKHCPSVAEWSRMRASYFQHLRRRGMTRCHWITEWQRRGVPHLHLLVTFTGTVDQALLIDAWTTIAAAFEANWQSQTCEPTWGISGWLRYLAKHGARGVHHYQRSAGGRPASWEGNTGRIWGHTGDWPRITATVLVSRSLFYRIRRDLRSKNGCGRGLSKKASSVRGYFRWIEISTFLRLVEYYMNLDPDRYMILSAFEDPESAPNPSKSLLMLRSS